MGYRRDVDLEFLCNCSSEDLDALVTILIKDKDGSSRLTEELTVNDKYKQFAPDHRRYWDLIAAELQCFGADTFATLVRGGEGVLYREVLTEVCDKMRVNYNSEAAVELIEMNLLMKVLTDSMEKMTPEDLRELANGLDLKTANFSKQAVIAAIQAGVNMSGFVAYQVAIIVANAVAKAVAGRGLAVAANAGLARAISVAVGPIGWALTALWTLKDLSGPAFRVTIPSVIQVAFLRTSMNHRKL